MTETKIETKWIIAIGDNANSARIPPISYNCVEGSTFKDIIQFQLPLLNKFKGAPIEVHLSAGHCDIVQASLKNHKKRNRSNYSEAEHNIEFQKEIDEIIRQFTQLLIKLRHEKNATLVVYTLRSPTDYTPICAGLQPLMPHYAEGVKQLNRYIKGWVAELNFASVVSD